MIKDSNALTWEPGRIELHRRRGSVYVMVLGAAVIVTILGVSAIALTRLELRQQIYTTDAAQATACARSAIDMGLRWIEGDRGGWRSRGDGVWFADLAIGRGRCSLEVTDADGDLSDDPMDPVTLIGTGTCGAARRQVEVTLSAEKMPISSLRGPFHVKQELEFEWGCRIYGDKAVSTNSWCYGYSADVYADVEAGGSIGGGTYHGSTTSDASPRSMPGADWLDHYLSIGTPISVWDLPSYKDRRYIYRKVLTPERNPFGSETNAQGVYILDCQGEVVVIQACRIKGTLVLLNPGYGTRLRGSNLLAPAVENFPVLLCDGGMVFQGSSKPLDEDDEETNYNPIGAPYEGYFDADQRDQYPSVVRGLVRVRGTAYFYDTNTFEGVLLADATAMDYSTTLDFTYGSAWYDDPPPGFQAPPRMKIVSGSWRRMAN